MNKDTNLTVAKICHEMANYLSVLNFIKEDIASNTTGDVREMFKIIELLTHTMDFFRNVYADNIDSNTVINVLKKIYLLKEINLFLPSDNISGKIQGAICCVLYTIMKSSKSGDIVSVSNVGNKVVINMPADCLLPVEVNKALSSDIPNNAFNILVNYAKSIARLDGYEIKIEDNLKQVVIWKQ